MTDQTKRATQWKPGQSGNPNGRPRGSGKLAELRSSLAEHVPAIIEKLRDAALGGDVAAARLLLERVIPPVKAVEEATPVDLPDSSLTDQGRAVIQAVAVGDLPATAGAALLSSLGAMAKLAEADELERRIAALEAKSEKH